jgi:hypothetical protein
LRDKREGKKRSLKKKRATKANEGLEAPNLKEPFPSHNML